MKKTEFLFLLSFSYLLNVQAQKEFHPFPFWTEGIWTHELTVYNGDTITDNSIYVVKKENEQTFHESWWLDIGDGQLLPAKVTKAFDKETGQWKMFYTDGSYAQVWKMPQEDEEHYFYKSFDFSGNRFLSRQHWQKLEDSRVIRTIERSIDDGKSWSVRYYMVLKKRDVE